MKKALLFLSILMVVAVACDMTVSVGSPTGSAPLPTNTALPATLPPTQIPSSPVPVTLIPNPTAVILPSSFDGAGVRVDPLNVVIPTGLARGARGIQIPRAEGDNVAPWEVTPGHVQLKLEGYMLQNKFSEPQIYVYPAQHYAEMYSPAFENIHRLNDILADPGAPISADQLPLVPFFNAQQLFVSHTQMISFQNGQGVRFLTQYAQYAAPVNNHDLLYHFQGVTNDGAYYIIVILPITMPALVATGDAGAELPSGGIPYPDSNDQNADWQGYYTNVTNLLNETTSEIFTPNLDQLDVLIQSMLVIQ